MTKYTEESVTGYKRDLDKIRARPTLYIGPTDSDGIFTLIRECMDNAVDEARAGRNNKVSLELDDLRGPFIVRDAGIGIPVGKHKEMKISTFEHVLSNLQSSGKIKGNAYKSAIGTHGVGLKGVTALSTSLLAYTHRDGDWYKVAFKDSKLVTPVAKSKGPKGQKVGTYFEFIPDPKIFKNSKLDIQRVKDWAEMTSYLNAGLEIELIYKGKRKVWKTKNGIKEYLTKRLQTLGVDEVDVGPIFNTSDNLELILTWGDVEDSQVEFFTNTVRNVEEGVHATAMYKALSDSLKPFSSPKETWTAKDLQDGLIGLLNYKIDAPQFDSQTKEKLVDDRVYDACYKECLDIFSSFWKKNKKAATDIIKRAVLLRKKTADFLKSKKLIKNVKNAKAKLSAKLADIQGNIDPAKTELFIVEGDSAGGSAKQARDRTFQAVFPSKGKPLNVMEAPIEQIMNNVEIASILAGIGVELDDKKALGSIRYGKIILLADPDVDGLHITTLFLTVLWKFTPNLFKEGRVYIVDSPEYMCRYKGKMYFGNSKEKIYKKVGTTSVELQHIKGWGEINPEDLEPIAFDPDTRKLIRVMPPEDKDGKLRFQKLMGKNALYRKQLMGVV